MPSYDNSVVIEMFTVKPRLHHPRPNSYSRSATIHTSQCNFYCSACTVTVCHSRILRSFCLLTYLLTARQFSAHNQQFEYGSFSHRRLFREQFYLGGWASLRPLLQPPWLVRLWLQLQERQDSWAIAKKTARCTQYMGALKVSSPHYVSVHFILHSADSRLREVPVTA